MNRERPHIERPPRPDEEPVAGAKRRRLKPLVVFGIAAFAVAALYVLLVVATMLDDVFFPGNEFTIGIKLPGVDSGEAGIEDRINILVMGLDRRIGEPDNSAYRTDSVFIATLDPASETAGIFSIPRDLLVEIPDGSGGYYTDRINVVWETGEFIRQDYPGGGPGLIKDTIKRNFDIDIHYYAILDFEDFIAIIDELGGIDIDVPEYTVDYIYEDCVGCVPYFIEFLPGPQHMDGVTALAYARIRRDSNDFKRIERQQLVVRAVAEKAFQLDLLVPPTRAVSLYRKYKDAVDTDIPDYLVPGLALLARDIGTENLRTVSIASATYPCGAGCTGAVLLADWEKVEELKAQVFGDGRLQKEGALVELRDGSNQPGLTEEVAGLLREQGIPEQDMLLAAAERSFSQTLIVNLNGKEYTAQKLAEWLRLPSGRIVDAEAAGLGQAEGDVVILLGSDVRLSAAAVPAGN